MENLNIPESVSVVFSENDIVVDKGDKLEAPVADHVGKGVVEKDGEKVVQSKVGNSQGEGSLPCHIECNLPEPFYFLAENDSDYSAGEIQALFSNKENLVEFGTHGSFVARSELDDNSKALKIWIKQEYPFGKPIVLFIFASELENILDEIRQVLWDIDESIQQGVPIYSYPKEQFVEATDSEFWRHRDVWISESTHFQMRFIHIGKEHYFLYMNMPAEGKVGPVLKLCRVDLDGFVKVMEVLVSKID